MREGPQLGVDAYGVRRCGSVMPVCKQPVATLTLQTFAKVFLGRRLESYYFLHMPEEITSQIKRLAPLLEEDSDVFRELSTFFGDGAKIEMHRDDLSKFLQDNRTFEVVRVSGKSYKDCVYELVDNYPEMMDAIGMLRRRPPGKSNGKKSKQPKSRWATNSRQTPTGGRLTPGQFSNPAIPSTALSPSSH